MGSRAVPQRVRGDVRSSGDVAYAGVNESSHRTLVDPPTPHSEEERLTAEDGRQGGATALDPLIQRASRWAPHRHAALLVALADHPDQPPAVVDIAEVEAYQLSDTDAGRVQEFQDRAVSQVY